PALAPRGSNLFFAKAAPPPPGPAPTTPRTATPVIALSLNLLACVVLLVSRQLSLALNIAVFAMVLIYFLHSLAFLLLPRFNPDLNRQITINMPVWLQRVAAWVSVLSMGGLILVQISRDVRTFQTPSPTERIS